MTYSILECCKLFNISISTLNTMDELCLRKKYHKLCLKYHPDKNKLIKTNDDFIKLQKCYEILLSYKQKEINMESNKNESDTIYDYFLSLFHVNNIEKILNWIESQQQNQVIQLHVSWEQVVSKDLYLHNERYIPLWHQQLWIGNDNKPILYHINVQDIPTYIKRLENNDILVYKYIHFDKKLVGTIIKINISSKKNISFTFSQDLLKSKYKIIENQGIPRINNEHIYDISSLSNIVILFIQLPPK